MGISVSHAFCKYGFLALRSLNVMCFNVFSTNIRVDKHVLCVYRILKKKDGKRSRDSATFLHIDRHTGDVLRFAALSIIPNQERSIQKKTNRN